MASSSQASSASRSTRSGRPPSVAGPAAPAPAPAFAAAVAATATAHSPSPGPTWEHFDPTDDVPVEVLVEHLLAAKRSLSSITLVLRANEIETSARRLHEEAVILSAQTAFLRRGVAEQVRVLRALRRGMGRAYDAGRREFKQLIKTLDAANARLEQTMDMLRHTIVDPVFRPPGEDPKCLLDFVDETTVDRMRDALKESIGELQVCMPGRLACSCRLC